MKVPMWPGSNELPFNKTVYVASLSREDRKRLGDQVEMQADNYMQAAITQRLWLMKTRNVEPVWIEV